MLVVCWHIGRKLVVCCLLAVAADRCSFGNRPLRLDPALAQEAAAVHTLSATANLPAILALFPCVELCLETKLCPALGLVRGCTVILDDILYPNNEPLLVYLHCSFTSSVYNPVFHLVLTHSSAT